MNRIVWSDLTPAPSGDLDLEDDSLTTSEAAALAGVSPLVVSKWRARGHLVASRVDRHGRPRYHARDVLSVEARMRRSPKSHRRAAVATA